MSNHAHASRHPHARRPHIFIEPLERRLLLSGQLDTTFNGSGKVTLDPGTTSDARDVAIQADGKVVVVGRASSNGNDFVVARFNTDGSPDSSFGTNGLGFVRTHVGGTSESESAAAVAIDSAGRIIVSGWTSEKTINQVNTLFAMARYLPDGSLDKSFDGNGTKAIDFTDVIDTPVDSQGLDVAIQGDGKIIWAGYYLADENVFGDFVVMRLNDDGSFDNTFDDDGKRGIDFGNDDRAQAVAVNQYGKPATNLDYGTIVLAGYTETETNNPIRSLAITKLNSVGHVLSGFGVDGKVVFSLPGANVEAEDVYIQPDNKIIVAGRVFGPNQPGGSDFFIARLNSNGTFDSTYGNNGFIVTDFSGGTDRASAIVPNADGDGLIIAGVSGRTFALAQYTNSNGALDARFGAGGKVTTDFGSALGGATVVGIARKGRRFAVAGGEHMKTARYLDAGANIVSIGSFDPDAFEEGQDPATFVVALSDRRPVPTRVFLSISGTAKRPGSGVTPVGTDYSLNAVGGLSSSVQYVDIPANQIYTQVTLTPINDTLVEPTETAIFTIKPDPSYEVGNANTTTLYITDSDQPPANGTFTVSTDKNVRAGEITQAAVTWTVPSGSWRQLNTIDLLLRDDNGDGTFALIRWDEAANTFALYDPATLSFGAGQPIGSAGVLSNPVLDVLLSMSSVKASGPTSPVVTVTFAFRFNAAAVGHRFSVDVASSNDLGHQDHFSRGALIKVKKSKLLERVDDGPLSDLLN